jgi:DUF1365 family protein
MSADWMSRSALYHGQVRHQRRQPFRRAFAYRLFNVFLDLTSLEESNPNGWAWPSRWFPWAQFRRRDHFGPPKQPLSGSIRDLVEGHFGRRPTGRILLLTQLRYWGYVINPVSFYYCYEDDHRLSAIVAEVQNTPWNERHCYVIDGRNIEDDAPTEQAKAFHVSPFLGMEMNYRFRFSPPGEKLFVSIENWKQGEMQFDACLTAARSDLTPKNLLTALLVHPWMTARIFVAIYWQALLLWWKGATYFPHPSKAKTPEELTSTPSE